MRCGGAPRLVSGGGRRHCCRRRRKALIRARLEALGRMNGPDIAAEARSSWAVRALANAAVCVATGRCNGGQAHFGSCVDGVNWFCYDVDTVCEVVECAGARIICAMIGKLVREYTQWCTGLPDLVCWNPSVEVCRACSAHLLLHACGDVRSRNTDAPARMRAVGGAAPIHGCGGEGTEGQTAGAAVGVARVHG